MTTFTKTLEVRWADVDANGHMRHSAYYDYGAHLRVSAFHELNFSITKLIQMGLGPVLFREEARFLKELKLLETFHVDCKIASMRRNGKIWSIQHQFTNTQDQPVATLTVEGAWLDLNTRKVITPPPELYQAFESFPRTDEFEWLSDATKG